MQVIYFYLLKKITHCTWLYWAKHFLLKYFLSPSPDSSHFSFCSYKSLLASSHSNNALYFIQSSGWSVDVIMGCFSLYPVFIKIFEQFVQYFFSPLFFPLDFIQLSCVVLAVCSCFAVLLGAGKLPAYYLIALACDLPHLII